MQSHSDLIDASADLFDQGWLNEVLYEVKSGKEATVFCCRGGDLCDGDLIAAKLYKPVESRNFRNDSMYMAGRMEQAHDSRFRRALRGKSAFGRHMAAVIWLEHEWKTMRHLDEAGVRMPQPLARNNRVILMPFFGDDQAAAPALRDLRPSSDDAELYVDAVLSDIELMLHSHRVHGDLSAYNILLWEREPIIIDFPQAVDPRLNPAAQQLLERDVRAVCKWAERCGVERDAGEIAADLWSRFVTGELG